MAPVVLVARPTIMENTEKRLKNTLFNWFGQKTIWYELHPIAVWAMSLPMQDVMTLC